MYTLFLKLITRHKFEEDMSSCLKTTVKGLTLFEASVLPCNKINRINEHKRSLETAKLTTVKDV